MFSASLGRRIILATMLPPLVLGVALLGLYAGSRITALRHDFAQRAAYLSERWNGVLADALARGRTDLLVMALERIAADAATARVVVRSPSGTILATRGGQANGNLVASAPGRWLMPAPVDYAVLADAQHQARLEMGSAIARAPVAPATTVAELRMIPSAAYAGRYLLWGLLPALGLLVGILIPVYFAGRLTAERVLTPARRIQRHIERIGRGDLVARLPALAGTELTSLERAVNQIAVGMNEEHAALREQVRQTTQELEHTLQSFELRNAELDVARQRALEGVRAKSQFLAHISHEIRTPINGIVGFVDLLRHTTLAPEQQEYVATIQHSCDSLLSIVNDVLDLSKIEAGKLAVDHVHFDIRDCVEEVVSLLAPSAYGKGLELIRLIYTDVPAKAQGDPGRVRQVLTNLVHNAVKFTNEGRIVVRVMVDEATHNDSALRIAVSDTGTGLAEEECRRLLQASQDDAALPTARRFGGSGLGLLISQGLVEQMAGRMGVDSERGRGTTFWFTLPVHDLASTEPDPTWYPPFVDCCALIYDADELAGLACAHMLEAWGMVVTRTSDPREYRQLAGSGRWALVAAGFSRSAEGDTPDAELLRCARDTPAAVIAFIASVDRDERRRYYQMGASVCLPKTARRQTVYRELCHLLGFAQEGHTQAEATPAPWHLGRPPHALVVDDNAINRKLVRTIAARCGIQVVEASDGHSAIAEARRATFDIVFMDLRMPGLSGTETARALRAEPNQPSQLRIIALTADAGMDGLGSLVEAGFDDCLIKPITESQVARLLRVAPAAAADSTEPAHGELLAMLDEELPEHVAALDAAAAAEDHSALFEAVHKLHGVASVCALPDLVAACEHCEGAAKGGDADQCALALAEVREAIEVRRAAVSY